MIINKYQLALINYVQVENEKLPSTSKQLAIVSDEIQVMSTEPACLEIGAGSDNCVSSEIVSSLSGKKRKHPGEFDNDNETCIKVSHQKRACIKNVEMVEHDHAYCIRSPRRLKKKVDALLDQAESFKKRLRTSQKKTHRLKKKVSSLNSVVSDLKKENLVSSDCASILERTFSGVPKELMKRLVTQKEEKSRCVSERVKSICYDLKVLPCKGI